VRQPLWVPCACICAAFVFAVVFAVVFARYRERAAKPSLDEVRHHEESSNTLRNMFRVRICLDFARFATRTLRGASMDAARAEPDPPTETETARINLY